MARYIIGIDPGRKTGLAVWDKKEKQFTLLETLSAFSAMKLVNQLFTEHDVIAGEGISVIVEDARQRKWYGKNAQAKLKGAGAIEARCWDWEDMLNEIGIEHQFVHPIKCGTKLTAKQFKNLTGWKARTSEHTRDAGMLVFQR